MIETHKKNLPFPEDFFIPSALLLLMLGIFADNHHAAFALDDLAFFTDRLNRRTNFHVLYLLILMPVSLRKTRSVLAAPGNSASGEVIG